MCCNMWICDGWVGGWVSERECADLQKKVALVCLWSPCYVLCEILSSTLATRQSGRLWVKYCTCNTGHSPGAFPPFSWPSCPLQLEPHAYTLPSCNRKSECCPPQATSLRALPLNTQQVRGSRTGFSDSPTPSCPEDALPQQRIMAPEDRTERPPNENGWRSQRREARESFRLGRPAFSLCWEPQSCKIEGEWH